MTDNSTATVTCPKCQAAMRTYERNGITMLNIRSRKGPVAPVELHEKMRSDDERPAGIAGGG